MNLKLISRLVLLLMVMALSASFKGSAQPTKLDIDFTGCEMGELQPTLLGGVMPASRLTDEVEVLSQPRYSDYGGSEPQVLAVLPTGLWVIVLELDENTRGWFRILVPCETVSISGWIPADPNIIDHSIRRTNISFAPPNCAVSLGTISALDEAWESTVSGTITAIVDLYRNQYDNSLIEALFRPTRNGRELPDKERRIETSGAFLLRSSAFSFEVQNGNRVQFALNTEHPLSVIANITLYSVSHECPYYGVAFFPFLPYERRTEFNIIPEREELGNVSVERTQPVDNMNGTQDLIQDIAAYYQFRHDIDLYLNESVVLNRLEVEDLILGTYDLPSRTGEQMCLIPADVPIGYIYAYDLEWTSIVHTGSIEIVSPTGEHEIVGTYSLVIEVYCQVVGIVSLN